MRKLLDIPGPKGKEFIEIHKKYVATTTNDYSLGFINEKGKGVYLQDIDGNKILDFSSGVAVANVGYGHQKLMESLIKQIKTGVLNLIDTDVPNKLSALLAQRVSKLTETRLAKIKPDDYPEVFYCCSGSESTEAAKKLLKSARPERQSFLSFMFAFHGRTMGALSLMGSKEKHIRNFYPENSVKIFPPYCYRCPYNQTPDTCKAHCIRILEDFYFKTVIPPSELNGVFIEFIQGEGGIIDWPKMCAEELQRIADKYNIFIVDDEIQAGMGRTGKWFACEHYGIKPHVILVAKAFAGGVPQGACIFPKSLDFKELGQHSNTFGGNLLACQAALAVIQIIEEENLVKNAKLMGDFLRTGLEGLQGKYWDFIGDIRGLGLMQGIEIVKDRFTKAPFPELRNQIIKESLKRGLLIFPCGNPEINPVIRFEPPLVVNKSEIDEAMKILDEAIEAAIRKVN